MIPANVPGIPHCFDAEMIGAMKANDDPRKMGTLPLVVKWKMKVPIPARVEPNEQRIEDSCAIRHEKELYAYYCSSEW